MPPVRFLHLPYVVLEEILKCLDPIDLFILSHCSKKVRRIIPLSGSKTFKLSCFSSGCLSINQEYVFNAKLFKNQTSLWHSAPLNCLIDIEKRYLDSYWPDKKDGSKNLTFYLLDIFQCPIYKFANSNNIKHSFELCREIIKRQGSISSASMSYEGCSAQKLQKFLDHLPELNVTDKLYLHTKNPDNFTYNFQFELPKCVELYYIKWFNLENLLSMSNIVIIDIRANMESNVVNEFLKNWKTGSCPSLEFLKVEAYRKDWQPSLGVWPLKDYNNRIKRTKTIGETRVSILEGVPIKMDDGRKAEMRLNYGEGFFKFFVHAETDAVKYFELIQID